MIEQGGVAEVVDWRRPRIVGAPPGYGRATLSTGGSYVVTEGIDTRGFTVDGGEGDDVTPDPGPFVTQRVVRWLDGDRYQALAFDQRRGDRRGPGRTGTRTPRK